MLKDLKLGYLLMKDTLNFYIVIYGGLLIVALMIFMDLFTIGGGAASLLMGLFPMLVSQMMYSISVSTMVQSSPYKKRLQTTIPTIYVTLSMLIANTFCVISQLVNYKEVRNFFDGVAVIYLYEPGEYETGYIISSVVIVCFLILGILALKNVWVASVFMSTVFVGFVYILNQETFHYIEMPVSVAILLSYAIALFGCLLYYIIAYITYRQNFSKRAFENYLKRVS